jgi:phosphoribosylformimino-5-aminoimidazole carboxamide ribotide isomerase
MTIYPAIDLRGGKCVRLLQGRADQETVYGEDPAAVARSFRQAGAEWVHVVDLDGAFGGEPRNGAAVAGIVAVGLRVQQGGGLRTRAAVDAALAGGATRVVIGTKACEDENLLRELVAAHGARVAVGIDARDGWVTVKGWVEQTRTRAEDLARRVESLGVVTVIYTDIATDGMLTGPNFAALEELLGAVRCRVIASGGVSRREDIEHLAALARRRPHLDGVIVGKALYERRLELSDALRIAAG